MKSKQEQVIELLAKHDCKITNATHEGFSRAVEAIYNTPPAPKRDHNSDEGAEMTPTNEIGDVKWIHVIERDKRIADLEQQLTECQREREALRSTRDELLLMVEWMKRKSGREWGTVWNEICSEYPYLAATKEVSGE